MTKVQVNKKFYPGIDTEFDKLADSSEFKLEITNAATGAIVLDKDDDDAPVDGDGNPTTANIIDGLFSEIMWTIPETGEELTATAAGSENIAGNSIINVASGHTMVEGTRFKIGSDFYYVSAVAGESVSIKGKLVADVAAATVLVQVGNTGIYKTGITLDTAGEYFVSMSHPEFGHISSKYEVAEQSIDSTYDKMMAEFNKLGSTGRMIPIN